MAEAIVMAESRGHSDAIGYNSNGSIDRGLFQINSVHSKRVGGNLDSLLDVETNVRVASQIFHEQGWQPWSTFTNKAYVRWLI